MNRVLYNVTVSLDESIHKEWLEWMKQVHIPEVMATGMFLENRICRVHAFEEGGLTYAVQYICRNMADLDHYQEQFAPALQEDHNKRYQGKFAAFRTVLEILHEHRPLADVSPN